MSTTYYQDCDADDLPDLRPPLWYHTGNKKPCSCNLRQAELLQEHVGYSDYVYRQWQCRACGTVWVDYLEG